MRFQLPNYKLQANDTKNEGKKIKANFLKCFVFSSLFNPFQFVEGEPEQWKQRVCVVLIV